MIRLLKTIHGWLGFFVMPWIILIGLSGIYLNHYKAIYPYLPQNIYNEAKFDQWPNPKPVDEAKARAIATRVFPKDSFDVNPAGRYHNRDVFVLKGQRGEVIVTKARGYYWVKTWYERKTYNPDGKLLGTKIYWGSAIRTLHVRGWLYPTFGTWPADITAVAMVIFGLSGIILFLTPRLRRRKNRKGREEVEVTRRNVPRPQRIKLKG